MPDTSSLPPSPIIQLRDILLAARERYGRDAMRRLEDTFVRVSGYRAKLTSPNPMQRPATWVPGLRMLPWLDPSEFEGVRMLEENWEMIRDEVFAARQLAFQRYDDGTPHTGAWNVLYVRYGAGPVEKNRSLCPKTMDLVNSLPRAGEMGLVSALTAGSHIEPHCGVDNFRVTAHLGLQIPQGCSFRVGDETRVWEEGKCLVFDDSFEHEVWNRSEHTRFILLVDFWHPDLTDEEIEVLTEAMKYLLTVHSRLDQGDDLKGQEWWS